jgi:transcriptional regulator with XRE-family HTH domain
MRLAELLKVHRAMEGFGLRDFAKDLEISPATLSRIERNENMDGKTLAKLISWLLKD